MSPEAMAALHAACFETPRPWSAAEFESLLATPGCFLSAGPAGFALGRVLLDEAELLTLAVAPDHRRSGHGRRLLLAFEAAARDAGAGRAFLEVNAENTAARALYESQGYGEAGRRKGYYRAGDGRRIDALVYCRDLG